MFNIIIVIAAFGILVLMVYLVKKRFDHDPEMPDYCYNCGSKLLKHFESDPNAICPKCGTDCRSPN